MVNTAETWVSKWLQCAFCISELQKSLAWIGLRCGSTNANGVISNCHGTNPYSMGTEDPDILPSAEAKSNVSRALTYHFPLCRVIKVVCLWQFQSRHCYIIGEMCWCNKLKQGHIGL